MAEKTHTVSRSFSSGDRSAPLHWALIKGHAVPLQTDELLSEGAAVRIVGGRAVRA